jgi:hypothetical protein
LSKFQVGDEVMIFADDEGFYRAEQSSVPVLRKAAIVSEADEDGDCLVKVEGMDARYANQDRIFPLETILIDGNPFFVGQRAITAEELFSFAGDSDGGVDLNMSVNPFPVRHDKKEDPAVGPNEDASDGYEEFQDKINKSAAKLAASMEGASLDPLVISALGIDSKGDPVVGPNEDSFYPGGKIYAEHINSAYYPPLTKEDASPEVTFTLEQVVALLNALKSEV